MIKFIKGENWCRWNGMLMSPEKCKELFGVEDEVYFEEEWIDAEGIFYTELPINELLMRLGEVFKKPEEYDTILNQGYGFKDYEWESKLAGHIMFPTDLIENLMVKPLEYFKKDYPNFNRTLHDAFYSELDTYYENFLDR